MTQEEIFLKKYGNNEIKLPCNILTIRDNYASPFSSGSNGYLTKVRVKNSKFEFYHDWWNYGWSTKEEIKKEYPHVIRKLNKVIELL